MAGIKQTVTVERLTNVYDAKVEYWVVSAQNILEPAVNASLNAKQVQALIDSGVTVNIKRRS